MTVTEGTITAVTPAAGPGADRVDVVDVGGRWVIPGLWDHHVHFDQWAQVSRRLDVSSATSAAALAALVAAQLDGDPDPDSPLVGYGFRDALWPDAPSIEVLDAATGPSLPVVLVAADLHCAWLNSAALRAYGHPGAAGGLLREGAAMAVLGELSRVGDSVSDAWARQASQRAAARGVVGILDLESPWNLASWQRRIAAGNDLLRVRSGVWRDRLEDVIALGLKTGDIVADTAGLLSMGPFKVITDGSLNTRTAYCHDPYPGVGEADLRHGLLLVPPAELTPLLRRAHEAGLRCAVHAIGDRANSLALQAFADSGARGSIEHAQLLDDADVPRFAELGVVASVQPEHAMDDRDVADRIWRGRTARAFALRSLLDAGARLALGSDAPVAPLDPWFTMAAAVTRSRDGRPAWHAEQCITRAEALAASVGDPSAGRPGVVAGAVADLVVIEADPLTCDDATLRTMPVVATLVGGRFTHRDGV